MTNYPKKFKELTKILNLTNNDFIRTTEKRHYKSVENIWQRLVESGDIYLDKYSGWYSISDEAYYDEDEIEELNGKKVSKVLDLKLIGSRRILSSSNFHHGLKNYLIIIKITKILLSPKSRRNEVIRFVEKGLKDLSVSRTSFSWGIPVPKNKKHIIYVWLDALTNYLSALNFSDTNSLNYKKYWPADIHIIGKDILRFHAIYWPAFFISSTKIPLPKKFLVMVGFCLMIEKCQNQ